MSDPVIACYVAKSGDSYEIHTSAILRALEYIPPEEYPVAVDEELVPQEDQKQDAFLAITTSGNFKNRPYFPVYVTRHGIRGTRDMVRALLAGSGKAAANPLSISDANKLVFEELAENGDCLVGKIVSPD